MTFPITGIKKGLGPGEIVPLRREIDEWWFSKDANDLNQRSLYILALIEFKKIKPNPNNPADLSYFSIAGIHGEPLKPWDSKDPKQGWYCAHGEETFPTWHRPYVLLYEQRLYELMIEFIPKFFASSDQPAMVKAAETFRLPYWDWAAKKPDWDASNPDNPKNLGPKVGLNVPFLLTQKTVQVKGLTGAVTVDNPMWKYQLQDKKVFGDYGIKDNDQSLYSRAAATSRHPTAYRPTDKNFESDWVQGNQNNWETIRDRLRSSKGTNSNTLPERVYRFYAYEISFPEFGTEGFTQGQPVKTYGSLEQVHGDLHVLIGGLGQMGYPSAAAFDPIFWLHHNNIDRLYAIWQDLHENAYSQWATKPIAQKALLPFHQDKDGKNWTSVAQSYQQKNLYYTYPELQRWLDKYKTGGKFDPAKYEADIRAQIEILYSTTGKSTLALPENTQIATSFMAATKKASLAMENFPPPLVELVTQITNGEVKPEVATPDSWKADDYVIDVIYDRFALGGHPYSIYTFLGDVPQDPNYRIEDTSSAVAVVYNFSSPAEGRGAGPEGCDNCRKQQADGKLASDQIPITDYLVENIVTQRQLRGAVLESLDRDEVVEYLKKNLHWRIYDHLGNLVQREDMPSLKLSVALGSVTHYREADRFSEYSTYEILYDVTDGRLNGAAPVDLGYQA